MRNRWAYFRPICDYLGLLLWVFGLLMVVPLVLRAFWMRGGPAEVPAATFWVPAAIAIACGALLKRDRQFPALDGRRAMMLCAMGWLVVSAVAAVPFCIGIGMGYLDAYFETVSGLTTTGITMLAGLDDMPRSILFWRSFIQWMGGLGILTFFLAVLYTGGSAHRLFGAESHKVFSRRPAPNLLRSLRILWLTYILFSVLVLVALLAEGLGAFDAVTHAMTTLSTGGYSTHDASIEFYRQNGYHYVLIEYTIIFGMLLGGVNFFVHYRVLRGGFRALWDTFEMRLWWIIIAGATGVIIIDRLTREGGAAWSHDLFRNTLFQVVSVVTTTGFGTENIADYPAASKQVLLLLMVIGGCVGSTGGGIKVLRIGVLGRMVSRQIRRLIYGPSAIQPVIVDGEIVGPEELRRVAALFFAWVALLVVGGIVTALLSDHDALASASGMFSALGNIGPCYIPVNELPKLHAATKILYIVGMLAGRLEILPLLLLFSPRTWK